MLVERLLCDESLGEGALERAVMALLEQQHFALGGMLARRLVEIITWIAAAFADGRGACRSDLAASFSSEGSSARRDDGTTTLRAQLEVARL